MLYLDRCQCREVYEPVHAYVFTGPCFVTGKPYTVTVPGEALFRMRQGVHIQHAWPESSADDREFCISGTSPEGWTQLFGSEEG